MSATNFATLYGPAAQSWNLPAPERLDQEGGRFRGLRVNWTTLAAERHDRPHWLLCCDVLVIERDLTIDRAAFVFARRIELRKGRSITLDRTDGHAAAFLIFAQEVVDADSGEPTALNLTAVSSDGAAGEEPKISKHPFFKPGGPKEEPRAATGLVWRAHGAPTSVEPEQLDPAFLLAGEPLRLSLMTVFQVATLLSSERQYLDVSIAQSRWVAAMAAASQDTADLSAQALAMAGTLLSMKAVGAALLVPRLDAEIYADKSKTMMEVLRNREQRFRELHSEQRSNENWLLQARSVLAEQLNQNDLHQKLEKQGEEARAQAIYARATAVGQVLLAHQEIRVCEAAFELGIERWKVGKQLEEAVNIVMGVFDILKAIPAIAAGAPQLAALPAIETAAGLAKTTAGIVNTIISDAPKAFNSLLGGKSGSGATPSSPAAPTQHPLFDDDDDDFGLLFGNASTTGGAGGGQGGGTPADDGKKAAEAEEKRKKELQGLQDKLQGGLIKGGEGAKKIFDAAMNIIAVAEKARKMGETSREILEAADKSIKTGFASSVLQGLDVVTGGQQEWDALEVEVNYMFDKFRDGMLQQIEGGSQYRRAYQRLLVVTRSLSQCRLAVAKANMQLAELKLRRSSAERSVEFAQKRLNEITERAAQTEMLAQFVFNMTLDSKRAVYLAMEAHNRAFLYFTLAKAAPPLPRITASVDAFDKAVAEIASKQLRREALHPPPQPMEIVYPVNTPDVIAELRSISSATWTLDTKTSDFERLARVRIDRIRVLVEGARSNVPIEVQIQTAGLYADKVPTGGINQFVSEPTSYLFIYDPSWTGKEDKGITIVDGAIAGRYKDDFFNPTPFTTFTIRVRGRNNGTVDLSEVTGLKVYFRGEITRDLALPREGAAAG